MKKLRHKGLQLSSFMIEALKSKLGDNVKIITPEADNARGCQGRKLSLNKKHKELLVSFMLSDHVSVEEVFKQLRQNGIVCDFREPNSIRTAAVPLYNTFSDVYNFVEILTSIYNSLN